LSSSLKVALAVVVAAAALPAFARVAGAAAHTGHSSMRTVTISAGRARTCMTAQLKIGVFHTAAAGGTVGGYIGFTNRATAPCRLSGWPTLVALTDAGASTAARRSRSTMFGPYVKGVPVVTLRPGERADAVFTGGEIPGPGRTSCGPHYRYLRVTPPGSSRGVLVSAWNAWLGRYMPNCGAIEVSMVVPSSVLYHG
jgi:hypothetical protein